MAEVDLSRLARGYDHRPASSASLAHARRAAAGLDRALPLADVGSGRGDHAAVWADMGYRALAVDPAWPMVREAGRRRGVVPIAGRAQSLPLRDGSLALVYFHLSIHYGDWRRSVGEAVRVLATDGRCVVWTLGSRHHRASMLARWFPSVADIDSARFPDPDAVATEMKSRGLHVEHGTRIDHVERRAGDWADAVRAGFVSTLQLVARSEFEAGLAAFARAHPDPDEIVEYVLDYDWLQATKARS